MTFSGDFKGRDANATLASKAAQGDLSPSAWGLTCLLVRDWRFYFKAGGSSGPRRSRDAQSRRVGRWTRDVCRSRLTRPPSDAARDGLVKTFRVSQRAAGLWGAVGGLVRRTHRTVRALDGISFALDAGELVGYIWPNGAGKSTTVKMLAGIGLDAPGKLAVRDFVRRLNRERGVTVILTANAPSETAHRLFGHSGSFLNGKLNSTAKYVRVGETRGSTVGPCHRERPQEPGHNRGVDDTRLH